MDKLVSKREIARQLSEWRTIALKTDQGAVSCPHCKRFIRYLPKNYLMPLLHCYEDKVFFPLITDPKNLPSGFSHKGGRLYDMKQKDISHVISWHHSLFTPELMLYLTGMSSQTKK